MLPINYRLANGFEVKYNCTHAEVCVDDINTLAMIYVENTTGFPTHAFLHYTLYRGLASSIGQLTTYVPQDTPMYLQIQTAVGPVIVVPHREEDPHCRVVVGTEEDFNFNQVDKIFEETVLAGCERHDV